MALTSDPQWRLTPAAFESLLQRMGPDRDAAAAKYETMRSRLVDFFDGRGLASPETLADETLDRVARKLDQGEQVEHLRAYFYAVAKLVLLESEKRRRREEAALADPVLEPAQDASSDAAEMACLERCLRDLPEENRELIVAYYQGAGRSHLADRKVLAERLRLSYRALKARAHRVRGLLERCLRACLEGKRRPMAGASHMRTRGPA